VAGFAAGTVFLLINLLLTPLVYHIQAQVLLRYLASILLGGDVLTDPSPLIALVGILVHYVLSLFFTLVIAVVVHRWGLLVGIVGGAVLGLAFYGINLYTMTLFFPWFFAINGPVLVVSHLLFGATAGGIYETLDRFDLPLEGEADHVSS
jgi:hypothetical protein